MTNDEFCDDKLSCVGAAGLNASISETGSLHVSKYLFS